MILRYVNGSMEAAPLQEMLRGLLSMAPRNLSGGSGSREGAVLEIVETIQMSLAPLFDIEEINKKYPTRYEESMNTVVIQEAIRYVGLRCKAF